MLKKKYSYSKIVFTILSIPIFFWLRVFVGPWQLMLLIVIILLLISLGIFYLISFFRKKSSTKISLEIWQIIFSFILLTFISWIPYGIVISQARESQKRFIEQLNLDLQLQNQSIRTDWGYKVEDQPQVISKYIITAPIEPEKITLTLEGQLLDEDGWLDLPEKFFEGLAQEFKLGESPVDKFYQCYPDDSGEYSIELIVNGNQLTTILFNRFHNKDFICLIRED